MKTIVCAECGAEVERKGGEDGEPELIWMVRTSVPFTFAYSKNAMWRHGGGHVYLRAESKAAREELTLALRAALRGRSVVEGRVWLDILVQKEGSRGDAINVLDTVADVVKEVIGIDDNMFSIRRLDWQIVKQNPQLIVGIGQEYTEPHRFCSYCGIGKRTDEFHNKKNGVNRVCKQCSSEYRKYRKRG
jgi:NADH pyrophosphatase NudC (nudix superfamily)